MRSFTTAILVAVALTPGRLSAQDSVDSAPQVLTAKSDTVKRLARKAGLSIKYDKIEGRIDIHGDSWDVKGGFMSLGPSIDMRLLCLIEGETIRRDQMRCALAFNAMSAIDWALASDPEVTLLADDSVRMRLGSSTETDFSAHRGVRSQQVIVSLPVDDVGALAGAHEVLGKIGSHQFKLHGQHLKELRGLAAIIALSEGNAPAPDDTASQP